MIIFAGGTWKDSNEKHVVDNLIKRVSRAIVSDLQVIETNFSKIVVGRRAESSKYINIINLPSSTSEPSGFAFGRLYEKASKEASSKLVTSINFSNVEKIMETNGKFLSKNYWGQYLILLQDLRREKIFIFPDPQGFSSLFYAKLNGHLLFSSDVWCIKDLLGKNSAIDDNFLRSQINCSIGTLATSSYTPFSSIYDVVQGYGIIISGSNYELVNFWDPFLISSESEFNQKDVMPVFFDVIHSCCFESPNICLELSGGLDSASLMMGLKYLNQNSDRQLFPITFYNELVSSSDERASARQVAEFCNTKLYSQSWSNPWCLEALDNEYKRLDKPHTKMLSRHLVHEQESMMLKHEEVVFWSGHGGDHIFCQDVTENSAADYWIDNMFAGLIEVIIAKSKLDRVSLFHVLKSTLSSLCEYYTKSERYSIFSNLSRPDWLFSDEHDISLGKKYFSPPFVKKSKHFKPGKFDHIVTIYTGPNQYKIPNKTRRTPVLYPFLAQPLVELALTMPTYKSFNQEHSRYPFRQEVSKFFRTDIVYRKSKGDTSGVLQIGLQQNIKRIYELCLEGYFAKKHLVDRKCLESHVNKVKHGKIESLHGIFNLIAIELWIESWAL